MTERPSLKSLLLTLAAAVLLTTLAIEVMSRTFMPHWRDYDSKRFMVSVTVEDFGEVSSGKPGFDGYFAQKDGDFRVRVSINGFGLRNPDPVEAADGRVWAVGDSITFGWGVEEDEMYSSVMGRLLGAPVYNIASPGTDVCGYQALLARMPETARPKAVVVGLLLENDVGLYEGCRARAKKAAERPEGAKAVEKKSKPVLLVAKNFLTQNSALYNFLAVSLKRLDFVRNLLTRAGIVSDVNLIKTSFNESEIKTMIAKTMVELERLRAILPKGTPLAMLIAPSRSEIRDGSKPFKKLRLAIGGELRARGFGVIDIFNDLKKAGLEATHFAHDGHWNALGHEIAGKAAADWVDANLNR